MNDIPTILYVDDDDNDVLLLKHAIRSAGVSLNVQAVNSPELAGAYLDGKDTYADRNCFPLPALVLLDLKMPRTNGFEVLAWIRKHPTLKHLVVIVLTASKHPPEVNRAYEMGANSYLIKPVALEALVELVKGIASYWMILNHRPALA
jgi:CheY-like chemotaxis protein